MTHPGLCPNPDVGCDDCVSEFLAGHPGVEAWQHTRHLLCECPWIVTPTEGGDDVCVGCGERRDLEAEFRHVMGPRRAA